MQALITGDLGPNFRRRFYRGAAPWGGAGASLAILRRELVATLRGRRSAIVVVLTCASVTYLLLDNWPPPETDVRNVGDTVGIMMMYVFWVLLCAGYVTLPGIAANAILEERQRQTFDLVKLSLVPPTWIVIAKLMNCVSYFLLLVAAVVPIVAITFYLVGVDIIQFVSLLCLIVLHAFVCSVAGLAVSAFCKRPFTAILSAYLLVVLISGLPTALANDRIWTISEDIGIITSPASAIFSVKGGGMSGDTLLRAVMVQIALFVGFFLLTILLVRKPERVAKESNEKILDDIHQLTDRRKRFPFYLIDPLRRRDDLPDGKNPMRIKELRWGLLGRETRMIRVCYVTTTVVFFASIGLVFRVDSWLMIQFGALVIFAPAFVAGAVSKEYEQGNMDLMRLTLIGGRELLHGKLWAAAMSLTPFIVGLVVGGIPMVITHAVVLQNTDVRRAEVVFRFYPSLFVFTALILAIGLFSSVLWRRTVASTVCSYAIVTMSFVASPLLGQLLGIEIDSWGGKVVAFLNPTGFAWTGGRPGDLLIDTGTLIMLQWCCIIAAALITVRISELLYVHCRMQDQ